MNISYKWLKDYVDFNMSAEEVAAALTSVGLEVGGVEEVQSIKGGLKGLVVGKVLTCVPHPNSDHMHVCTVVRPLSPKGKAGTRPADSREHSQCNQLSRLCLFCE